MPQGTSPRIISCVEQGKIDVPLSDLMDESGALLLNPEVRNKDYFGVTFRRGALGLQARGYVGLIPLNDRLAIFVEPRVPISNLTRMAEISGVDRLPLSVIRTYATGSEREEALFDLYAAALIQHVQVVVEEGLHRQYRQGYEETSFPTGRLLINETLRLQARGVEHKVRISRFERTIDNALNQCLKYALWRISQQSQALLGAKARKVQRQVNLLYPAFEGVTLDHDMDFLRDGVVEGRHALPPLRAYYRDALDVARAALMQRKVFLEKSSSGVRLPSVVMDMNDLFERYVRRALEIYAAKAGWQEAVLDGNSEGRRPLYTQHRDVGGNFPLLDAGPPPATPDVVILGANGEDVACVLDMKNKPVDRHSDRDGVNQVLAYALRYATDRVVLVHPAKSAQASGMLKVGDIGEVSLFQYRYNLDAEAPIAEEQRFGESLAEVIRS
ncbi:hypothetical protein AB0B52_01445 [Streptomyces griseofuscus]|uniref:McrC family protein n=1 Tax=Streptomyces griseofuscus TaxID=146922 RepID=UPI0033FAEF6C